jgi:hypothetical protein
VPVEFGVWRIDGGVLRIPTERMDDETRLEAILERDIAILGLDVMLIGRQVRTSSGKRIDLLAIDSQGHLCVIEVKKDRTPRDVAAQILEYGSWICKLTYEEISSLFALSGKKQKFEEAYSEYFGQSPPEELNEEHRLVLVASDLDQSTEQIVSYLSEQFGVPINAVFFRCFKDGGHEYLARTWLIEPGEAEARTSSTLSAKHGKEPWSGHDYYVSLGEGSGRSWDDCVKYGFVSGGGGPWYSRTLSMLPLDGRVFVCIPNTGYVGVGVVIEQSQMVKDFKVTLDGKEIPILKAPLTAPQMGKHVDDPDRSEYLVRIKWLKTLSREKAIWEKGMFANQNTACKLRNKFTIERLIEGFGLTA